jgi:hypothetical protein
MTGGDRAAASEPTDGATAPEAADGRAAAEATDGGTPAGGTASDDWTDAGETLDTDDGTDAPTAPWPDADGDPGGGGGGTDGAGASNGTPDADAEADTDGDATPVVERVRAVLADLDDTTRAMLAAYRDRGPCSPLDAHVAAGGDGDRTVAYRRNSELRRAGLINHAGRGRYAYALPTFVEAAHAGRLDAADAAAVVDRIEDGLLN